MFGGRPSGPASVAVPAICRACLAFGRRFSGPACLAGAICGGRVPRLRRSRVLPHPYPALPGWAMFGGRPSGPISTSHPATQPCRAGLCLADGPPGLFRLQSLRFVGRAWRLVDGSPGRRRVAVPAICRACLAFGRHGPPGLRRCSRGEGWVDEGWGTRHPPVEGYLGSKRRVERMEVRRVRTWSSSAGVMSLTPETSPPQKLLMARSKR